MKNEQPIENQTGQVEPGIVEKVFETSGVILILGGAVINIYNSVAGVGTMMLGTGLFVGSAVVGFVERNRHSEG